MRDDGGGGQGVHIRGPKHWSPVTWLIVLTVGWYLIHNLFLQPTRGAGDKIVGGIWKADVLEGHIYLLVTYLFVHGSLMHLLFNMLGLFFLGRMLQQSVGPRRFLQLYFIGGIFAGVVTLVANWNSPANSVGASGAVLAVAIATCFGFGEMKGRLLFPPISFKFRTVGFIIIGLEIVRLLFSLTTGNSTLRAGPAVDVWAHLGGIVAGLFFWKVFMQSSGYRDSYAQGVPDFRPPEKEKRPKRKKKKPSKSKPFVSTDVDAILDKINENGIHSLTPEERKILDQRSDELAKRLEK